MYMNFHLTCYIVEDLRYFYNNYMINCVKNDPSTNLKGKKNTVLYVICTNMYCACIKTPRVFCYRFLREFQINFGTL